MGCPKTDVPLLCLDLSLGHPGRDREVPLALGPYDQAKRSHADCPETVSADPISARLTSRARNTTVLQLVALTS
jgi:hypothetical protein